MTDTCTFSVAPVQGPSSSLHAAPSQIWIVFLDPAMPQGEILRGLPESGFLFTHSEVLPPASPGAYH